MKKKYSIAFLIPMHGNIEPEVDAFVNSVSNDNRFDVQVLKSKSASIVANRNNLLNRFLTETDKEIAVPLDTDNCCDIDTLIKMIEYNKPAVFGLYKDKIAEKEYLAGWYKKIDDKYEGQKHLMVAEMIGKDELFINSLDWSGMGLCVIRRETLVKLKEHLGGKPFIEQPSVQLMDGSWDVMLEDVYFCRQLKEAGFEIEAYLSSKIKHLPRDIDRKIKLMRQGVFTLELHATILEQIRLALLELPGKTCNPIIGEIEQQCNKGI